MSESSRGEVFGAGSAQPFLYVPTNRDTSEASTLPPLPREAKKTAPEQKSAPGIEGRTYEKGLADGEARARAAFEKSLAEIRSQVPVALREFTLQRETYFGKVETEIVQLALSIARKILHRESQMDPLLLTGVVRVALEGLSENTQARLRAHPDEVRFWRDYFSHAEGIRPVPEVVGDPSLAVGNCTLETDLGSTHISFETQLKEIESGFLDLLDQRPRGA